jgi:acyl dehydratase
MTSGYFEDFEVGYSRKVGPYLVSKAEIIQFAKQFDPRPYTDEEAAVRSVFGELTAHAELAVDRVDVVSLVEEDRPSHRQTGASGELG